MCKEIHILQKVYNCVPTCIMAEGSSTSQCVDSDGLPYTPLPLSSVNSPDMVKMTHRVYLVDMVDSKLFEESISRLMKAAKVGLVGKGEALGREGVLGLLVFATEEYEVFVFDILTLGMGGFQYGLYAVLHCPDLVKVSGFICYKLRPTKMTGGS